MMKKLILIMTMLSCNLAMAENYQCIVDNMGLLKIAINQSSAVVTLIDGNNSHDMSCSVLANGYYSTSVICNVKDGNENLVYNYQINGQDSKFTYSVVTPNGDTVAVLNLPMDCN